MDSADLRAFVAFADSLNFTHAARAVHLSQPALFAVVKRLADAVGAPLYERRGRALALLPAGERLATHARAVVADERALLAAVRGDADDAPCVLACGEGALTHVVGDAVASFVRSHPRRLRIVVADGPAATLAVARGHADVAVVAGAVDAGAAAELVARSLRSTRVIACGTRAFLDDAGGAALSLPALAALPLVLPPVGRPLRKSVDDALGAHALTPNVAVEASGWEALVMLARLGCGVAVVNDVVAVGRGLIVRPVEGLLPVVYRTLSRRRRRAIASELLRALHG